ncbi:MAG TPA: class I mannose-6-phosphate isomerase [Bacteroidales bacterium]|nr:class I mannose-6-phosphate isomerase [Bacteroidales bacterium]
MNELYPLKFKPIYKEKIWGGKKINEILKQDYSPLPNCGELWALSGMEDASSEVSNGFLKNNALNELVEVYMGDLVGDMVYEKYGDEFPLLFKFINAEDYLSVQVHPGDELAMQRHQCSGKTEMWYVIAAEESAELISGFKQKITKEEYLSHLNSNTLKDILNYEKVQPGDVFYVPSGHVHAIGPGILLAEIQQSSDITYRIYDWDRFDQAGMIRELHTDLALDAINFGEKVPCKTHPETTKNHRRSIQKTAYFNVNLLDLDRKLEQDFNTIDSFAAYLCIDGAFTLVYAGNSEKISKGESVLVPAIIKEFEIIPSETCKILETYIL